MLFRSHDRHYLDEKAMALLAEEAKNKTDQMNRLAMEEWLSHEEYRSTPAPRAAPGSAALPRRRQPFEEADDSLRFGERAGGERAPPSPPHSSPQDDFVQRAREEIFSSPRSPPDSPPLFRRQQYPHTQGHRRSRLFGFDSIPLPRPVQRKPTPPKPIPYPRWVTAQLEKGKVGIVGQGSNRRGNMLSTPFGKAPVLKLDRSEDTLNSRRAMEEWGRREEEADEGVVRFFSRFDFDDPLNCVPETTPEDEGRTFCWLLLQRILRKHATLFDQVTKRDCLTLVALAWIRLYNTPEENDDLEYEEFLHLKLKPHESFAELHDRADKLVTSIKRKKFYQITEAHYKRQLKKALKGVPFWDSKLEFMRLSNEDWSLETMISKFNSYAVEAGREAKGRSEQGKAASDSSSTTVARTSTRVTRAERKSAARKKLEDKIDSLEKEIAKLSSSSSTSPKIGRAHV